MKKKNDKNKKTKGEIVEEETLSRSNNQLTVVSTTGYNMVSTTLPKNFFEGLLILEMELNDEFTMEKLLTLVNQYSLAIEFYLETDPMKAKAYQNRMEYLLTNKDTLVQLQRQKNKKNNENNGNEKNEKNSKIIRRSTQFNKTKTYVKLKQEDIRSEDISKKVNKVLDTGNLKDDEKKNVINLIEEDIKKQDESWKNKYKKKRKNKLRNSTKVNIGGALLLKKKFFGDKKSDLALRSSYSGDLTKKNKKENKIVVGNLYEIKEDNNANEEEKEEQKDKKNEIVENKENNNIIEEKKEEEKKDGEDNKDENNNNFNLDDLEEVDEEKIEEKKEDDKKEGENKIVEEKKEEENKIVEEKKEEENKIVEEIVEEKKEEENKIVEEKKEEENKIIEEKKEEENKIVEEKKEGENVINTNEKEEDKEINILESFDPNSLPPSMNRTSILDEDMIRKIKPDDEISKSIEDQIKYLQNMVSNLETKDANNKNDNDNDNEEDEENEDNKDSEKGITNINKIIENKENKDDKKELIDSKVSQIPAKFQSTYYQVESLMNEYMNDFNEFYYKEIFEQFSSQLRELYELKYKKYIEIRNEYHTQIKENEYLLDNDENLNEEKKTEIQQTIDSLNEEQQHQIATIEDEFNRKIIDKISEFKLNSFKKNSGIQLLEEQVKLDIYSLINESFY